MLTLVTRVSRDSVAETGGIVLNTSCISKLRTYNTTQSRFKFLYKPEKSMGGHYVYVVAEAKSTVKADMDRAFSARTLELNCYEDNDATKSTVATVSNVEDIVRAYPVTRTDRTKCYIEINQRGFGIKKYLVAHYYVNIYDLAKTGTTTTTSTTSTTSSSTTSTTSTSTT